MTCATSPEKCGHKWDLGTTSVWIYAERQLTPDEWSAIEAYIAVAKLIAEVRERNAVPDPQLK